MGAEGHHAPTPRVARGRRRADGVCPRPGWRRVPPPGRGAGGLPGACTINFAGSSATITTLVEPETHRYNIGDVAPHPYVADIVAIVPQLDASAWFECTEMNEPETAIVDCPDVPAPFLLDRTSGTWSEVSFGELPPSLVGTDGNWTSLSASQLLYATAGAGTWRGTLTW